MRTSISHHNESILTSPLAFWRDYTSYTPILNLEELTNLIESTATSRNQESDVPKAEGKKRAAPDDLDEEPKPHKVVLLVKDPQVDEPLDAPTSSAVPVASARRTQLHFPRLYHHGPSTPQTGETHILHHTFEIQYTKAVSVHLNATPLQVDAYLDSLLRVVEKLRGSSLDPQTIHLGNVGLGQHRGRVVALTLRHPNYWLALLPTLDNDINLEDHDFTTPDVQDLMMTSFILQSRSCARIQASLNLVLLPDGAYDEARQELPFRLQLEVNVSLLAPALWQSPVKRDIKKRVLELEDAKRRVLDYLFPRHSPIPDTFDSQTNISYFYSFLRPAPEFNDPSMHHIIQPTALNPTLLPFQRRSVGWLLGREGKTITPTGEIVPRSSSSSDFSFWEQVEIGNYTCWYNRLSGVLSPDRPDEWDEPSPYGGILAEEPGLGKTVEMIALIMLNPAPPERNPSVSTWDPESQLDVRQIKTTLIVTPPALASQWVDELATHAPSLKVMVYDGWTKVPVPLTKAEAEKRRADAIRNKGKSKATRTNGTARSNKGKTRVRARSKGSTQTTPAPAPEEPDDDNGAEMEDWCTYAHSFDVIITTYTVLRNDLAVARAAPERYRRADVKYANLERPRSPLVMCEWNRVIMDEVQMVGGGKTEDMVSLIPRLSSFAVSGTPAKTQVADLIRVLRFLRVGHIVGLAKHWQRLLQPAFAGDLAAFFQKHAVRTMKATIKHELTMPMQNRYLVSIDLGPVERHVYDQNLESALIGLGLDSRGVAAQNGWEVNSVLLRAVLRNLRGICTHPQVGHLQAKSDKIAKSNALKTMEEVLEGMRDVNWRNILDDAKARIQSIIKRAQLVQKNVYDQQRHHDALTLLNDAEKQSQQIIAEIDAAIADHDAKGERLKQQAQELRRALGEEGDSSESKSRETSKAEGEDDDGDDEGSLEGSEDDVDLPRTPAGKAHRQKKATLRQRLREFQLVLHQVKFLQGDVYHALRGRFVNSKDEDDAYGIAEDLRRTLLKTTEQEAERAMEVLSSNAKRKQLSLRKLLLKVPYLTEYGIRSSELVVEFHELVEDVLNPQAELLWEWRERLTALLTDSVAASEQEADGQEYQRTLDAQGEADSYIRAYSALLADMRESLVNERTLLATHDVREKRFRKTQAALRAAEEQDESMLEGLPELQPEYEVLYKQLSDKRKELVEGLHDEDLGARAVKSILVDISNIVPHITKEKDPERIIVKNLVTQIRTFMSERTALIESYEADLNLMRKAFNQRVLYFRQLQEISDSVTDVTWEGTREAAIAICAQEENELMAKLVTNKARQRYLDNLTKERDEGRHDDEDEMCVLCRCEFDRGYITQCAHIYCADCMKLWLGRGFGAKTCPVCRVIIDPDTIQRFTINEVEVEAPKQPANGEMPPQSRRKIDYNTINPQLYKDIQTMESFGDYGTKIQTMVRHLLYLKFNDPGAKSIVFSAWADSLTIMELALKSNGIPCLRIDQKTKGQSAAKIFKNDPQILVLLLHGERENAGLNITCASRVFLMESVVHHGFELQAIARIDRMGQNKETEVYCYYAEDTIERNILDLAARRGLSVYTKTTSAGTLNISNFIRDEVDQKVINKQVKKSGQKGDFIFRVDDMLAILFPHLYEDLEYLIPPEDQIAGENDRGDVLMRDPSLEIGGRENAVAGPSRLQ